jgi:HTH-type transcriptional regulator, competence development regulator
MLKTLQKLLVHFSFVCCTFVNNQQIDLKQKRIMNKFGDLIRNTREEKELLLRHIAAALDVDTALVSKIERGEKIAKREHVLALAQLFNINPEELIALWLADQVYTLVANEEQALDALRVAEEEVKYLRKK